MVMQVIERMVVSDFRSHVTGFLVRRTRKVVGVPRNSSRHSTLATEQFRYYVS
jgi:hypothetical protein